MTSRDMTLIIAAIGCFFIGIGLVAMWNAKKTDHKIQATRFGIVDCSPINDLSVCLVKDQQTKKLYLICGGCTLTEYKEKK
jgi:hypothetical protein